MKLETCPFCGGGARIDCDSTCDISWSIDNASVECQKCGAKSDVFWANKLDEASCNKAIADAVKAWNARFTSVNATK